MSYSSLHFQEWEAQCAENFRRRICETKAQQIIYLSGLSRDQELSRHLRSRRDVERILQQGKVPVTVLRAGIILGSGSASFEIMRDLVEKLPVMIAPKWVHQQTQPIAVHDVLIYLVDVCNHPACIGQTFEIGGPEILTYKEMLLRLARLRHLCRWILTVPVLTPKLSSYWLYFVTSTSYSLARSLVESLKNKAVCQENRIRHIFSFPLIGFDEAIQRAFQRIEDNAVLSSWKDAWRDSALSPDLNAYRQVPTYGCLINQQIVPLKQEPDRVQKTIWSLGGHQGWLTMDWAWKIRGWVDQLCGGVGLRRGRTHPDHLKPGDALDFWRVLIADEPKRRLLLYAEMKLPGEAWLEFQIVKTAKCYELHQTATFRPHGIAGRLYWYSLYPLHRFIFRHMALSISRKN
jgi:hypothetical protein